MTERWENQEEAYQFAISHPACMLDMEMGTGKTLVAIHASINRTDCKRVLVVCPKAVLKVWSSELAKHAPNGTYMVWTRNPSETVAKSAEKMQNFLEPDRGNVTKYAIINYDSVWRAGIGNYIARAGFDMIILDESHRAKSAGSKVSKYLAMVGKKVKYRMCLSGTPMANSPLDVYGQYRFLDPTIFGTNHDRFLQEFAIMGGPERRFVVGFKNQNELNRRFRSIAYTCKMSDVASRLKLPEKLPPIIRYVNLPRADMTTMKDLSKEFIAECKSGTIVIGSVLTRAVRMQQIASGFCKVQLSPGSEPIMSELNSSKADDLAEMFEDVDLCEPIVVFCMFKHDLNEIRRVSAKSGRGYYELSGSENSFEGWKSDKSGAVLGVQIQAGAEGVDMTKANHAVYYSLPYSLAVYEQSKARLYRPGQNRPVSFTYLIASDTIDETIYDTLQNKKDLIDAIKDGSANFGYLK